MSIEENWNDVTVYHVTFETKEHNHIKKILVLDNHPSDDEVAQLIFKQLPNVDKIERIDEWGDGITPKHEDESYLNQ